MLISWDCFSKGLFNWLDRGAVIALQHCLMTNLTVLEVREFSNVVKALLAASQSFLQEDLENVNCPCFSLLPSELVFCDVERTLARSQDYDYRLVLILRRLRWIFFRIRDCVRTHTLQLLDDYQCLRAEWFLAVSWSPSSINCLDKRIQVIGFIFIISSQ